MQLADLVDGLSETVHLLMEVAVAAKLVCNEHDEGCYLVDSLREKLALVDEQADKRMVELGIHVQPRAQA